jgi:hypothetical protein
MSPSRLVACVLGCVVAGLAVATPSAAQTSGWGVTASAGPGWKAEAFLKELFYLDEEGDLEGSEVSIGFVRGTHVGGDWGVSFVRKSVKNARFIGVEETAQPGFGTRITRGLLFNDVRVRGVEFHRFFSIGTIADRVQIGLTLGVGMGVAEGRVLEAVETVTFTQAPNGPIVSETETETAILDAADVIWRFQPLLKVEFQTAVLLAPGLKLKIGGGLNNPGTGLRLGVVYFFGQ